MSESRENEGQSEENGSNSSYSIAMDLDEDMEIDSRMCIKLFITSILRRLMEFGWDEELEQDLYSIWYISVEDDISEILFELLYPRIVSFVVKTYSDVRVIEIVFGILANIFSSNCVKEIDNEDIDTVLQVFSLASHSQVLAQICRFLEGLSKFDEDLMFLNAYVVYRFIFILGNSFDTTLLLCCLGTLAAFTLNPRFRGEYLMIVGPDLYYASFIAYHIIINEELELNFEKNPLQNAFKFLLYIISDFSTYLYETPNRALLELIKERNDWYLEEVKKVLKFYAYGFNMLPVSDTFEFYIETFCYSFTVLHMGYNSDVFKYLLTIIILLIGNDFLETDPFCELFCYLVCNTNLEQFENDVKEFDRNDIAVVVNKSKCILESHDNEICRQILLHYNQ